MADLVGGLQDEAGNDVAVVYSVTLSYVVSATGPVDVETLAHLVTDRIEAAGGVEEGDIDAHSIIGIERA